MAQHFFYGGDKDGEPVLSHCTDELKIPVSVVPEDIHYLNDSDAPIQKFKTVRWYHCIMYNKNKHPDATHYFVREDIYEGLKKLGRVS